MAKKYLPSEDLALDIGNNDQLWYKDNDIPTVELYITRNFRKDNQQPRTYLGNIRVWTDRSGHNREYILINHEVCYLDEMPHV